MKMLIHEHVPEYSIEEGFSHKRARVSLRIFNHSPSKYKILNLKFFYRYIVPTGLRGLFSDAYLYKPFPIQI